MKQLISAILFLLPTLAHTQSAYWQQHVATNIEVTLNDKTHQLHGYEELTYTNNSPDTLTFIYIHLWPNAYKNDVTPFAKQQDINKNKTFYLSPKSKKGYIDSLQFTVDGKSAEHHATYDAPDIARLDLPKPLLPGSNIKIATPFRVQLPSVFSRSGHYKQAYYVTQWFPKPAVYDKTGWHPMSYLDQGEFYSEYGSYQVAITLPKNYIVMATGQCTTPSENAWLDSLSSLPLPSDTLYLKSFPASDLTTKTIVFKEDSIHDFAWFADKRFIVQKDTVISPGNGKLVTTWSAFLPSYQEKWKHTNTYLKQAVTHYGKWVGPYPYSTIKAVLGDLRAGGGMEYPTITLIDKAASNSKLSTVVIHEAGHNWFYGILGSNERDVPWMDEGLNTFYEQKTTNALDTIKRKKNGLLDESTLYYQSAKMGFDQPMSNHSDRFTNLNYGLSVYYKSALFLQWLEAYMGHDNFDKAMKSYYNQWHHRHPYPEDFRAIMEAHTNKPLSWFFDTVINTNYPINFAIKKVQKSGDSLIVTVKNKSHITAPALVTSYWHDSALTYAWTTPFQKKTKIKLPATPWSHISIDKSIPDAVSTNNTYKKAGPFHKFGISLRPFIGANTDSKHRIYIAPALGYNAHDKLMAGLLFHNLSIPENRFTYAIAPMWSFKTSTPVGTGAIGYSWFPNTRFREVMLSIEGKSFHFNQLENSLPQSTYARYTKIAPSLTFHFKPTDPLSPTTATLQLKQYNITEDQIILTQGATNAVTTSPVQNTYYGINYTRNNKRTYNPFGYSADAHGNQNFLKLNLQGNLRIDYYARNKALYVRAYAGKFFNFATDPTTTNRYILNASYGGNSDYLYDGTYRGRNVTGFGGQQISALQEGGFKIPVFGSVYRSDNWLASINLKTDLPKYNLPIRLFFDAGIMPNPNQGFKNIRSTLTIYDAGIELYLAQDIVSFYFPILMSPDYKEYLTNAYGNKNVLARSISFTLHLQNINWLRLPTKVLTIR